MISKSLGCFGVYGVLRFWGFWLDTLCSFGGNEAVGPSAHGRAPRAPWTQAARAPYTQTARAP